MAPQVALDGVERPAHGAGLRVERVDRAAIARRVDAVRADRHRAREHDAVELGRLDVDAERLGRGDLASPQLLPGALVECEHAIGAGGREHPSAGDRDAERPDVEAASPRSSTSSCRSCGRARRRRPTRLRRTRCRRRRPGPSRASRDPSGAAVNATFRLVHVGARDRAAADRGPGVVVALPGLGPARGGPDGRCVRVAGRGGPRHRRLAGAAAAGRDRDQTDGEHPPGPPEPQLSRRGSHVAARHYAESPCSPGRSDSR